jgi:hypothetical protein
MPKPQPTFTIELKHQAVQLAQTSGKPKAQIARELGISDSALSSWCPRVAQRDALCNEGPPDNASWHSSHFWESSTFSSLPPGQRCEQPRGFGCFLQGSDLVAQPVGLARMDFQFLLFPHHSRTDIPCSQYRHRKSGQFSGGIPRRGFSGPGRRCWCAGKSERGGVSARLTGAWPALAGD